MTKIDEVFERSLDNNYDAKIRGQGLVQGIHPEHSYWRPVQKWLETNDATPAPEIQPVKVDELRRMGYEAAYSHSDLEIALFAAHKGDRGPMDDLSELRDAVDIENPRESEK